MRLAGSECGVRSSVQVLGVTSRGRLPQASVTLMGSGYMEWSRERDRVINVSAGLPFFPRSTYADCIYDARSAHGIHTSCTVLTQENGYCHGTIGWRHVFRNGHSLARCGCCLIVSKKIASRKVSTDAVGGSRQGGGWT